MQIDESIYTDREREIHFAGYEKGARDAFVKAAAKEQPVPFSLEVAKRAYNNGRIKSGAQNMNLLNSTQREDVRHEGGIAAVLDAAGVQYVE